LSIDVAWEEEASCLEGLCREFAKFYSLQQEPNSEDVNEIPAERAYLIEHRIFPALRHRFNPPQSLSDEGSVVRIASLDKLYKVFQRC